MPYLIGLSWSVRGKGKQSGGLMYLLGLGLSVRRQIFSRMMRGFEELVGHAGADQLNVLLQSDLKFEVALRWEVRHPPTPITHLLGGDSAASSSH